MKKIMWILNITPDSFYDWGKYNSLEKTKIRIEEMIAQGADLIDVWAFSSKPGSVMPSVEEELERLIPVLDLLDNYGIDFSVDTCRSAVVERIIHYKNLRYINDISGLKDEKILKLIEKTQIWYILMHIKWTPENMQNDTNYDDIINNISGFFEEKLKIIWKYDIKEVILDVWFWFWKSVEDNYKLLKNLDKFRKYNLKILSWLSRKSMIYKPLDSSPESVLDYTLALSFESLKNSDIIRVHDVKEHKNLLKLYEIFE